MKGGGKGEARGWFRSAYDQRIQRGEHRSAAWELLVVIVPIRTAILGTADSRSARSVIYLRPMDFDPRSRGGVTFVQYLTGSATLIGQDGSTPPNKVTVLSTMSKGCCGFKFYGVI